jgi:hypothetical protein
MPEYTSKDFVNDVSKYDHSDHCKIEKVQSGPDSIVVSFDVSGNEVLGEYLLSTCHWTIFIFEEASISVVFEGGQMMTYKTYRETQK